MLFFSLKLQGRVSQGHRISLTDLHTLVTQSNKHMSCAIARLVRVQLNVVVYFNIPPGMCDYGDALGLTKGVNPVGIYQR